MESDCGASRITRLAARPPLGAYVVGDLGGGPGVRVAVVQSAAILVSGDHVLIRIRVDAGARLELLEIASTVAYPVRGGAGQRQRIEAWVATGGQLLVREQPMVLAGGCELEREVRVVLDDGAAALWSEGAVFGRHGEEPGAARLRLRAEHAGRPLLDEQLDTCDPGRLRSAVVAGPARAVGTVALLGCRDPQPRAGVLELAGPGCLARAAGDAVSLREVLDPIQAHWRALLSEVPWGRSYNDGRPGDGRASAHDSGVSDVRRASLGGLV